MWPLPSSAAIPIGNPLAGLSLVEGFAIVTILVAGILVFTLARLSMARPQLRVVRCPVEGVRAYTVVAHPSTDGPWVVYCSQWRVRAMTCDRSCLPKAA